MVAPITGPFVTTVNEQVVDLGYSARSRYYARKERWKQRKPYDRPLRYTLTAGRVLSYNHHILEPADGAAAWLGFSGSNAAKIVAYDRFKGKISDRAQLAVSILEADQSLRMIANRALQLVSVVKALKRGRLGEAWAHLKQPGVLPRRVKPGREHWANNYLEFHFGWAPLVSDIHSAVDVLQNPFNDSLVRASAYDVSTSSYRPGQYSENWDWTVKRTTQYGAQVRVNNPNLWLANQLGLINPLSWVYEKIPFSFVADWFFNVSQFLEMGTDMCGLTLVNPYTTQFNQALLQSWYPAYGWECETSFSTVDRVLSISQPSFGLRPIKLWGWRRTAAAVSLLTQQLGRK